MFTERMGVIYCYMVWLGETSLAQAVRGKTVVKGKIYFLTKNEAISFLTQRVNLTKWPN